MSQKDSLSKLRNFFRMDKNASGKFNDFRRSWSNKMKTKKTEWEEKTERTHIGICMAFV